MTFYATPTDYTQRVVFILFATIIGALVPIQLVFLQKLIIVPVRLLPLLSFCMCYENVVLALGDWVASESPAVISGNVFHSLQIPLFVIILYETTFRLYQARSLQLSCLRFDLGGSVHGALAELSLWGMRVLAAALFTMNILADFAFLNGYNCPAVAGLVGYVAYFNTLYRNCIQVTDLPPSVSSFIFTLLSDQPSFLLPHGNIHRVSCRCRWCRPCVSP